MAVPSWTHCALPHHLALEAGPQADKSFGGATGQKGIGLTATCHQGVVIRPVIGLLFGERTADPSLLATCVIAANQSSTVSLPRKPFAAAS